MKDNKKSTFCFNKSQAITADAREGHHLALQHIFHKRWAEHIHRELQLWVIILFLIQPFWRGLTIVDAREYCFSILLNKMWESVLIMTLSLHAKKYRFITTYFRVLLTWVTIFLWTNDLFPNKNAIVLPGYNKQS